MLLHSFQEDTNTITSCIHHHPLVLGDNDSTHRAVSRFNGAYRANYKWGCQKRFSGDRHSSNELYDWLVRDLVSHHTNHLVTKAGLAAVYLMNIRVRHCVNKADWYTTWYAKLWDEVGAFLWQFKNLSTDTSGVSAKKGLILTSFPCESCLTMSHPLPPKRVKITPSL